MAIKFLIWQCNSNVGVSLLAIAVDHSTSSSSDTASSRAGSLLQGICVGLRFRGLPSRATLHPPPQRPGAFRPG
ncbi:hypothetical protein EJA71_05050 [Pseudomonas sp. PB106]|nr:hypothetical protein EJA71_05050 [Pseudomonas sp. PB106]